jgi:pyruvate decarboxylase
MASDIVTRELKQPINLVEYLYRRLHEVGVRSVNGVPGKLLPRRYE